MPPILDAVLQWGVCLGADGGAGKMLSALGWLCRPAEFCQLKASLCYSGHELCCIFHSFHLNLLTAADLLLVALKTLKGLINCGQ